MFLISIALRSQPIVWTLMFKKQDVAEAAWRRLSDENGDIEIKDEFGQTFCGAKANLAGLWFENAEESRMAHIERGYHEQRIRAAIASRCQADPHMRAAAQGPAMLTPMMGRG